MANTKITDLTALAAGAIADTDVDVVVDVSDTTMDASGTTKKITWLSRKADMLDHIDSATATFTNKTVALGSNTVSGTTAQFNTALSDGSFATLAGTETLTNKTLGASTLSGTMSAADQIVDQPKLQDYSETVNAIGSIGGGTQDIDLEFGNVVTGTVDTSTTTFTFSNPPASGNAGSFTLILTNGGSQTVNWPASVDWAGGTAPTLTASGRDVLTFLTVDGGTIWYGFEGGLNFS